MDQCWNWLSIHSRRWFSDSNPSLTLDSCFLDNDGPWHREIHSHRFSKMFNSAECYGSLLISVPNCKGLVLESVFTSRNPFLIFGLVFLLVFLGAFEAVYNRSKRRFHGMVF